MKNLSQGSLILSRAVPTHKTRRRFLFAILAILACSSLLLFNGPWSAHSQTRRASRAVNRRAKKIAAKKPSKVDRDRRAEPREGVVDDPEGRLNWFWFQRTYPFNEIPDRGRSRAWESLPQRDKGFGILAGGTTWSSIGPTPTTGAFPANGGVTSGRINAIAVSPTDSQIVLIGSATGGIWRSTNGGTTFTAVTDNQVDLAVGTIAFAPSNANIVYAGMGDRDNGYFGTGVLKSTDAGATWTKVSNTTLPDKGQCMRILVDPADPNKVYLAEDQFLDPATNGRFVAGVYVSVNGGVNWTNPLGSSAARDLAIHPTNSQIIYAAIQNTFNAGQSAGIYKSVNGGTSWAQVYVSPSTPGTRDIHVATTAANANRVYAFFGSTSSPNQLQVEMSDDLGVTWTTRGVISNTQLDPQQFGYNTYLVASPTDANTIYVGARDVFRSTDAGVTFTDLTNSFASPYTPTGAYTPNLQKFHSDQQSFAFQPGSSTIFYAGCDGGLYKTIDSGATFTSLNTSLSLTQFVSIGINPLDATKSYGGTQDNGTQRRTGGAGWTEYSSGDGGKLVVNPLNPAMVFSSYVSGVINRHLANGVNYDGQIADADSFGEAKGSPRIGFYPPIVGNGVDAKIYVGTWRLFICTDCNDSNKVYDTATPPTWTAPGGMTDLTNGGADVLNAIAIAKSNNNVIYTGSRGGHAMVSVNAGATWGDITTGLPTRTITSIRVSPTDPTLVYLTVSGYGSGHIFRSINSGTTWTNISNNLPNIPTSDFLIDPLVPTTLYAGTDIGVFRSTDNGATWTVFNDGLPPVPVMAFTSLANGLIQIGTYGRGAYELPLVQAANTIQLSAAAYAVGEATPGVTITVTRTGDTSAAATVNYTTSDTAGTNCNTVNGAASSKCDYLATLGTLRFAAAETSKNLVIPIINDTYAEGAETFTFTLSSPTGGTVGTPATAVVTITDNEAVNGPNPIDTTSFFVRQHYVDFLNREPDAAGLNFWINNIDGCSPKPACTEVQRINTSAAFFISIEFQDTGYFVYRAYKAAFGDATGTSTTSGNHNLPVPIIRLNEFLPDTQRIGQGVVVGQGNWQQQISDNKTAFTDEFVQRTRFLTDFPLNMTPAQFVDQLNTRATTAGVAPLTVAERNTLVASLTNGASRGAILRAVIEDQTLQSAEFNRAFVLMQFFGYMRRNPNDPQDTDYSGYEFWLGKLNQFNGNFANAEMVKAFITSGEYRARFGP